MDAVITSPPYPNEKDYTRTTRLESVLLGFISDKKDIRLIKKDLVRSKSLCEKSSSGIAEPLSPLFFDGCEPA